MTPEFDPEHYVDPRRRSRYGRVPTWQETQRSHDRRYYGDSSEWSGEEDDVDFSRSHHNPRVPYHSRTPPHHSQTPPPPRVYNDHIGRKSKKQVHYRNTPTLFSSGSAPRDTRWSHLQPAPVGTYRDVTPDEEYFLSHTSFARSVVDDFIEDVLLNEIIPDTIEDVFTEILRTSSTPLSESEEEWSPRTLSTFDRLDEPVVEAAVEEGAGLAREALRELVTDYMKTSVVEDIVEDVVHEEIPVIARRSLMEATEENIVDEEYIAEEVKEIAAQVAVEVLQYYTDKKRSHEFKKVEQYAAKKMVDVACLDKLLSIVTKLGVVEVADENGDKLLDDMILTIILDQYMDIYAKQRSTLANAPLKRWHKNLVADVAMDLILNELCDSLDEDLADLDEYEISFDSRPTDDVPHILTAR